MESDRFLKRLASGLDVSAWFFWPSLSVERRLPYFYLSLSLSFLYYLLQFYVTLQLVRLTKSLNSF
jgi:hypothetical protein